MNLFNVIEELRDHDYIRPSNYVKEEVIDEEDYLQPPIVESPPQKTYRKLPGIRQNSTIYVDNVGFKYYKRESSVNTISLVCERQKNLRYVKCFGTASVNIDMMDNRITIRIPHNHQPNMVDIHVPLLRYVISERGLDQMNTTVSVRTIYNNEIIQHPEGAQNYTHLQAARRVSRMRSSRRLSIL